MTTTIILITHGGLGAGLVESAAMICGDVGSVHPLSFDVGQSPEDLKQAVDEELSSRRDDEQPLFLVDLPGGTPARVAAEYAARGHGEAVAGVNLPMLIEVVLAVDRSDAVGLAKLALNKGREGVIDVGQQIRAALSDNGSAE